MSSFTLPNVVQKQRSKAYKAVFMWLYMQSTDESLIELNADAVSQETGISRRQIYRAVKFLERVNLLKLKIRRTGRGRHSLFWLNWRKFQKKCAIISRNQKHKDHIHDRSGAKKDILASMERRKSRTDANKILAPSNQRARAFRELLTRTWMMPSEQSLCVSVLLRWLKTKPVQLARGIFERLASQIHLIDVPLWVEHKRDLARWWMGIVVGIARRVDSAH